MTSRQTTHSLKSVFAWIATGILATASFGQGSPSPRVLSIDQLKEASVANLSDEARANMLRSIDQRRNDKRKIKALGAADSFGQTLRPFLTSLEKASGPHPVLEADTKSVKLEIAFSGHAGTVSKELEALGLHVDVLLAKEGHLVVSCPPAGIGSVLTKLQTVSGVDSVKPVLRNISSAGAVRSEGDAAHGADLARANFGVDGSGVRTCVISDGIRGANTSQASGDLPATIEVCPFESQNGSEGTAMLEIVHDLAPGAELGFCSATSGTAGIAAAINWLANDAFGGEGCDVIVDDVFNLFEGNFQDDFVATAVDAAAAKGIAYFSSAGNSANAHYEANYRDTDIVDSSNNLHDWGLAAGQASDTHWAGLVAGSATAPQNFFIAALQWAEPFGGASSDYDFYLFDDGGLPAGDPNGKFPNGFIGVASQDGDDSAFELVLAVNESAATETFFLVVDLYSGTPRRLEITTNPNLASTITTPENYTVAEGSVVGHAAANGAFALGATGAVNNQDGTANPGLDIIEPFSSRGISKIFFAADGTPAPEHRFKPDFTAADGVSVTGNGGFPTTFFGTSAAAPHAAAIAALVIEAAGGSLDLDDLFWLFAISSQNRAPFTTWGYGYLDAEQAVKFTQHFFGP